MQSTLVVIIIGILVALGVGLLRHVIHIGFGVKVYLIIGIPVALFGLMTWFCHWYLGIGRKAGFLLAVGIVIAAFATGVYESHGWEDRIISDEIVTRCVFAGLLVLTGLPLVIKLYRGWLGGHLTERENSIGASGFRAWLSAPSLILAVIIAFCAQAGPGYPAVAIFVMIVLALVAYPAMRTLGQPGPSTASVNRAENLTAEREKVLALLEAGRITAEESAELLNALGSTLKTPEPGAMAIPMAHRAILIGAGLVLIGFFLPWFTVDLGKEMDSMQAQLQSRLGAQFGGMIGQQGGGQARISLPNLSRSFGFQDQTVNFTGGDVQHGMGWIILLLSVGAALLPLVRSGIDAQTERAGTLIALGVGAVMVVYLVISNLRYLNIGILLAAAGYCVQWAALLRRGGAVMPVAAGIREHA